MKRTYLHPKVLRRAMPEVVKYVEKDGKNFLLGIRVNLGFIDENIPKGDQFVTRTKISEALYKSFIFEAKKNHARFKVK